MNEREMFLYELDGHGYTFENMTWLGNCFEDNFLNMAWEMWTASAQREGYKLVPVCSHEWSIQLSGRFICDLCGEFMEIESLVADEAEAMIGVVDSPLSFALNHAHNKLKENADRIIKHQESQIKAANLRLQNDH